MPTPPDTDTNRTVVIFRHWQSPSLLCDVIALFPLDDEGGGMCDSFEHHGQHGSACYQGVIRQTRPATPAEYADVKAELEAPPYRYLFDVRKRRPSRN